MWSKDKIKRVPCPAASLVVPHQLRGAATCFHLSTPFHHGGGGPGNFFGEVALIWRQNLLQKVLPMHWMNINLSVGDHKECISIKPKSNHCLALVTKSLGRWCCWDFNDVAQTSEDVEFTQPILANVEFVKVVTWIVKVVTWICQSCYNIFISRPLPNKTKLKFVQDFEARWMAKSAQ